MSTLLPHYVQLLVQAANLAGFKRGTKQNDEEANRRESQRQRQLLQYVAETYTTRSQPYEVLMARLALHIAEHTLNQLHSFKKAHIGFYALNATDIDWTIDTMQRIVSTLKSNPTDETIEEMIYALQTPSMA